MLLQSSVNSIQGYTDVTGTIMNMTLYLLPLITLLLGGLSAAVEKEDGQWQLLSTYPITIYRFLWGKWIGLSTILLTMLLFSFGLAGLITVLFQQGVSLSQLLFLWTFSAVISIVYLSIALLIGAVVKNRWQALILGITVWFITVIVWPLLMISSLSQLPSYQQIQPSLQVLTILNPAEFVRVFSIMRLGAGSSFGASYDEWITWATSSYGLFIFMTVCCMWIIGSILIGSFVWSRSEANGKR